MKEASARSTLGSPAKWSATNSYNMQKAKSLTAIMMKSVRDNETAERASKDASTEQTAREKQQLRDSVFAKAAAHGDVIGVSSKCMWDLEDGMLQTDNSCALLRQNRALGFASLQVCKRRTQLRDRRPKSELIKDYVAIALESEQKFLEAAREEFLHLEAVGRKISEELAAMRNHLSADTGSRRLIMKKDQQSSRPHLAPPPEMQRAPPVIEDSDSQSLLEDTFNLLERSNRHRAKSMDLVDRTKSESRLAVVRVEDNLEKKTEEMAALGKDLRKHMDDADAAIDVSSRSIDRSQKRLDPNDTAKKEKLMRDRALLEQLKKHKDTIHHEIQAKFIALEIDNMCRRVTPVKACEPSLLDANNAAEMKNQNQKALCNSASAPSLTTGTPTGGTKLPALAGTADSFGREKFGNTSPKFNGNTLGSSASSGALGAAKVKQR